MLWSTRSDREVGAPMPASNLHAIAYGLLSAILGLGYAAVVVTLAQLLGRDSSLAVALTTLAVAAVLWPAWRRSQRAVHRRFHRRRGGTPVVGNDRPSSDPG
jgi:uncharacterized membrane protein YfcA